MNPLIQQQQPFVMEVVINAAAAAAKAETAAWYAAIGAMAIFVLCFFILLIQLLLIRKTHLLERNTNGLKDELIRTTHALGVSIGREQIRDEQKVSS